MNFSALQAASVGRRFRLLFFSLLIYLLLYSEAGDSGLRYWGFRTVAIALTVLSVYAISFRRTVFLLALLLAIPLVLKRTHWATTEAGALALSNYILSVIFDSLIVVVLTTRVFRKDEVTSETVYGALCIYLLLGLGFSNLYMLAAAVQQHAFYLDPAMHTRLLPDRFDLVYFSFGVLTTSGASGIAAATAQTRSLSIVEAILGVLYLAVLVARIVGAYRTTHARP